MIKIEELKKGTKVKHITSGNIAEIKYICEDDSTIRVNMGIINGI